MTGTYDFGVLRTLRQKRNLTLEELAKASGLSYPTVASIETNKSFPSLKTIDAIAGALQVSTSRLISLASRKQALAQKTTSLHAQNLKDSGINLERINFANFEDLKIFRAVSDDGGVVNSMKLHDNCDCSEICYCLSGSVEIKIKNDTHRLEPDDVILFDGALDHEYTVSKKTEYLVIHFPKESALLESVLATMLD